MRKLLVGLLLALPLVGCFTQNRHRTIVLDQTWSSDAAVRNLYCVQELKKSCAQEARKQELDFTKKLSTAFLTAPDCAIVKLIVSIDGQSSDQANGEYWRLRVDFHPGLSRQPITLGQNRELNLVGGDGNGDEQEANFICNAAKNNGVLNVW